jgi:hypothetical protein
MDMANLIKSELQFLRQSAIGNDKERQRVYGRGQTRGQGDTGIGQGAKGIEKIQFPIPNAQFPFSCPLLCEVDDG